MQLVVISDRLNAILKQIGLENVALVQNGLIIDEPLHTMNSSIPTRLYPQREIALFEFSNGSEKIQY